MRSFLTIAFLLLAMSGVASAQTDSTKAVVVDTSYRWVASMDSAAALAKESKRNILVAFEAEWCRWCTLMRDSVWNDPQWRSLMQSVVFLRLDGDRDTALVTTYHVLRYPTTLLVTDGGQEIERWIGYRPAVEFLDSVTSAIEGSGTLWDLERLSQKEKADPKLMYAMARKYLDRGDLERAYDMFTRTLGADASNTAGIQDDIMFVEAQINRQYKNWYKAIEQLRQLIKRFPESEWREDAELYVPWLYAQAGDTTEAVKAYDKFLENFKSSSETQWVQRQLNTLEKPKGTTP